MVDSKTGITTKYYYDNLGRSIGMYETGGSSNNHRLKYSYDEQGRLKSVQSTVESDKDSYHTTEYDYNAGGQIKELSTNNSTEKYIYDVSGRLSEWYTYHGNSSTSLITKSVSYKKPGTTLSSSLPFEWTYDVEGGNNYAYTYAYDANGNIISETVGGKITTYVYDSANQLIRENNEASARTWVWTYDNAGNILKKMEYTYTTGTLGGTVGGRSYTYGNSGWKDLLTNYNGKSISYDTIGNPLYDGTWTYTWQEGRKLAIMANGSTAWTFTYDANGMRTKRTNGSVTYNYVYHGDQLEYMSYGDTELHFSYDASGKPLSVTDENKKTYYYVLNLQGDVVAIVDSSGAQVVSYRYDAYGRLLAATGTMGSTLGQLNPIRYRGYVYDRETGLYYLQSRYYNPEMGRFINADSLVSTGQGLLGCNMFSYCNNNPINLCDCNGWCPHNGIIVELYNANCSSCNFAIGENDYELYSNLLMYKEHSKKGTTNPANKNKHQKGQTRKIRDNGGEKGDARRTPNPNKRRNFYVNNIDLEDIGSKIWSGVLIVGGSAGVIYLVVNDASIVGVGDDVAIVPLLTIIWDNVANIAK